MRNRSKRRRVATPTPALEKSAPRVAIKAQQAKAMWSSYNYRNGERLQPGGRHGRFNWSIYRIWFDWNESLNENV